MDSYMWSYDLLTIVQLGRHYNKMMMEFREDKICSLRAEVLHLNWYVMTICEMNSVSFLENMGKIGEFNGSP